jgi:hypothetical protein
LNTLPNNKNKKHPELCWKYPLLSHISMITKLKNSYKKGPPRLRCNAAKQHQKSSFITVNSQFVMFSLVHYTHPKKNYLYHTPQGGIWIMLGEVNK